MKIKEYICSIKVKGEKIKNSFVFYGNKNFHANKLINHFNDKFANKGIELNYSGCVAYSGKDKCVNLFDNIDDLIQSQIDLIDVISYESVLDKMGADKERM